MADETEKETNAGGEAEGAAQISLNVIGQYIKDLSFESPGAPNSLQSDGPAPKLEVSVNVQASGNGESLYETVLTVHAHAKRGEDVVYNVELVYGGMFRIENAPQQILQQILLIDCPAILFPFARRVIADVSRDGGFPPLMLDPIDFRSLYARNMANAQAQASASQAN
ncbi:protein-export chaperone SecB [Methyloligella sp. 2.7D]|uniref:protein-export chaperone SecB n=1 Tax=unclassified Methyloligella TaxID=2625955 RepID=UPI00157D86AA|nr:protein-export chaperone SecB [Methyloligella sp. GL2]QKP76280.1 protein-export chaperone SecB [Methyloligella sp. GL2]